VVLPPIKGAAEKRISAIQAAGRENEPQHLLYFFRLPHGQGSFRPIFLPVEDLVDDPEGGTVGGCTPVRKDMPPTSIDPVRAGIFP
jgi:hypothetical protein